jgi:hypothetical protein
VLASVFMHENQHESVDLNINPTSYLRISLLHVEMQFKCSKVEFRNFLKFCNGDQLFVKCLKHDVY